MDFTHSTSAGVGVKKKELYVHVSIFSKLPHEQESLEPGNGNQDHRVQ